MKRGTWNMGKQRLCESGALFVTVMVIYGLWKAGEFLLSACWRWLCSFG